MVDVYDASYCALHVRKTNKAALGLYRDTLGFHVDKLEKGYCKQLRCCFVLYLHAKLTFVDADGEDAYAMKLWLKS